MPDFTSFKIMGQCKKILEKVTALPDTIAAVKNVVDSIKTLVNTNNTASETGVLSQKISFVADILKNKIHGNLYISSGKTQSWTCPIGVKYVIAVMCSGSGGGGGGAGGFTVDNNGSPYFHYPQTGAGGGSGSLGVFAKLLIPVTPGTAYNLVVGAGGSGGTAGNGSVNTNPSLVTGGMNGGNGGNGGDTKFGNIITLPGGKGGAGGTAFTQSNTGGKGGAAGAAVNKTATDMLCFQMEGGSVGNAGTSSEWHDEYNGSNKACPGAASKSITANESYIVSSGAGGAGGKGTYGRTGNGYGNDGPIKGSAGSAGKGGFIRLYW